MVPFAPDKSILETLEELRVINRHNQNAFMKVDAERNKLRAVNAELLAAIKQLIGTSQASPAEWVKACADVAAAIARAEGKQ